MNKQFAITTKDGLIIATARSIPEAQQKVKIHVMENLTNPKPHRVYFEIRTVPKKVILIPNTILSSLDCTEIRPQIIDIVGSRPLAMPECTRKSHSWKDTQVGKTTHQQCRHCKAERIIYTDRCTNCNQEHKGHVKYIQKVNH